MKKVHYPQESGSIPINGAKMSWVLRRSKNSTFFGINGSRIFELTLKKNGEVIGTYSKGWTKEIAKEDEEGALALSHILSVYGREAPKKKKEMGSLK